MKEKTERQEGIERELVAVMCRWYIEIVACTYLNLDTLFCTHFIVTFY